MQDCMPIIQRVQQKMKSWTSKFLSFAGRAQLVNAVLFHVQSFWSNAFIIPSKVMKRIEACCRNFLWTGDSSKVGMPRVSWEHVCVPRVEGGLGIKQFKAWNQKSFKLFSVLFL